MKKGLLIALLVVGLVAVMGGVALAGGWTTIDYTLTHDPNDTNPLDGTAIWNPVMSGEHPHGSFSSATNKCRVCHAVHGANATSWRLLRDTSRATECNACHGAGGITQLQPYRITSWSIRGEHTIGSDQIPDSTVTTYIAGGLSCGNCHSVHGGNTLIGVVPSTDWDGKILKLDPNGNGITLGQDGAGAPDTTTVEGKKTGFCADCHNRNSNWDATLGEDTTDAQYDRPNRESHVQGPAGNGTLEVYGASIQVAGWGTAESSQTTTAGCRSCHAASDLGNRTTDNISGRFPHRTPGNKLMFDSYSGDDQEATNLNDAQRVVSNMDILCGKCHRSNGDINDSTAGVGITF